MEICVEPFMMRKKALPFMTKRSR